MKIDKWHNCYEDSWKDLIVPEAFAHPAKMAYGLTRRIFKHALSEGWIKPGDIVVDPFGGIGSTGIVGAHFGLQVVCVELEEKFCRLAKENFERHYKSIEMYKHFGKPLHPVIIQGDSRNLSEIIGSCDCMVCSPPYVSGGHHPDQTGAWGGKAQSIPKELAGYGQTPGQLGAMNPGSIDAVISSPPFAEAQTGGGIAKQGYHNEAMRKGVFDLVGKRSYMPENQGTTEGNLSAMKPGNIDMVISSPPYAEGTVHGDSGIDEKKLTGNKPGRNSQALKMNGYGSTPGNLGNLKSGRVDAIISSPPYAETLKDDGTQNETAAESRAKRKTAGGSLGQSQRTQGYGSKGNLGNLKPGQVDAIVSSPPYEGNPGSKEELGGHVKNYDIRKYPRYPGEKLYFTKYEKQKAEGNLGNEQGETFWQAAKQIVSECHKILKEGGYAIWVVKAFVRNKKIVDFPGDWRKLCESLGFETVHIHHALLVKEERKQSLFGHEIVNRKERKSFFRRLAEQKGSPRIDYEVVLCTRKKQLF